jgi:hypothetical protein
LDAGHTGANAGVFRDAAVIGLGHIQVGADENTLPGSLSVGTQIGKTNNVHGEGKSGWIKFASILKGRTDKT